MRALLKLAIFVVMLGSLGMGMLMIRFGPWIALVFPAVVAVAAIGIATHRSRKLRAAMRAADEDLERAERERSVDG